MSKRQGSMKNTSKRQKNRRVTGNTYSEDDVKEAVELISCGSLSKKKASELYNIPQQTIQYRMGNKFKKPRRGPSSVLTQDEEDLLVKWLTECGRKGFPKRQLDLLKSVEEFLKLDKNRKTPFTNGIPGKSWLNGFLRRHPDISYRTPEAVTAASANISARDIKKWFLNIEEHLKEDGFFDILKYPDRIFNGDETNILLCPKTGKVLAKKGTKNVYEVDCGTAKSAVTVMFTFSAAGESVPPMIIYPYVRLPKEIIRSVPENWGIGRSETGWMRAENFFEYIANIFIPFLDQKKIRRPIILFVDGHKSHLTYQVSKLSQQEGIVLIALYPNATRILQPADVAAFRPLKQGWINKVSKWKCENPDDSITKELVAPLLESVWCETLRPEILKNGFKACGLYPWDFSAIDMDKCLGNSSENIENEKEDQPKPKLLDFRTFRNLSGPLVMKTLINKKLDLDKKACPNEFETAIKKIYAFFGCPDLDGTKPGEINRGGTLQVRRALFKNSMQNFNEELLTETSSENIEQLTPDYSSNNDYNSKLPANPKQSEIQDLLYDVVMEEHIPKFSCNEILQVQDTVELATIIINNDSRSKEQPCSLNQEDTSLSPMLIDSSSQDDNRGIKEINLSNSQTLKEILHWPTTPKRKGVRTTVRMPYVISSNLWKEMYEQKDIKKRKEEEAKEKRRKIREKNKAEKENKKSTPKVFQNHTSGYSRDQHSKGSLCYKCGGNAKINDRNQCNLCTKIFHKSCSHPNEELDNEDIFFVCSPCLEVS